MEVEKDAAAKIQGRFKWREQSLQLIFAKYLIHVTYYPSGFKIHYVTENFQLNYKIDIISTYFLILQIN